MANWIQVADQLNAQPVIFSGCVYNGRLYGGTSGGQLLRLNIAGDAWEQACAQLNLQNVIYSLAVYDGRLYGGTSGGGRLFRLNIAGDAWEQVCAQLNGQLEIYSLAVYDGRLYGGTSSGGRLFRLNIAGDAWEQVCAQLNGQSAIKSLAVYNGRLYGGTFFGARLFRLNLAGNAWEQVCAQLNGQFYIHALIVYGARLYGSTGYDGLLFRFNIAGDAWEQVCAQLNGQSAIGSLAVYDGRLYGGTNGDGLLFRFNVAGDAWEQVCAQLNGQSAIGSLIIFENSLYGGTGNGGRLFRADGLISPIAEFSAIPLSGVFPLSVQFTDLSMQDPTEWLWEFGDSESSTDQNPEHTYQNIGKYTVTLTATSSLGFDVLVKTDYITVRGSGIYLVKNGNNGNAIENSIVISHNNASLEFATTDTPIGDMIYNLITYNYGAGSFNITNPVSNVISSQPNTDPLFTEVALAESSFDIGNVMEKMFLPQKTSPIFNNGDNQFVSNVPIDIVGNRRIYISGVVDIGPYELEIHQLSFTSEKIKTVFQDKLHIDHTNKRFTPAAGDDIYNDLWSQFVINPEYREEFSRESKIIIKMKVVENNFNKSTDKFDTPLAEYEAYYDSDKMSIIVTKTDDFFGNMINSIFDDGRYVFFFSEIDNKLFIYINPIYNKGRSGKTNIINEVRTGGLSMVSK